MCAGARPLPAREPPHLRESRVRSFASRARTHRRAAPTSSAARTAAPPRASFICSDRSNGDEVHVGKQVQHEVRQVVFGQPLVRRSRQQECLTGRVRAIARHTPIRSNPDRSVDPESTTSVSTVPCSRSRVLANARRAQRDEHLRASIKAQIQVPPRVALARCLVPVRAARVFRHAEAAARRRAGTAQSRKHGARGAIRPTRSY